MASQITISDETLKDIPLFAWDEYPVEGPQSFLSCCKVWIRFQVAQIYRYAISK